MNFSPAVRQLAAMLLLASSSLSASAQDFEFLPGFHAPGLSYPTQPAQVSALEPFHGPNGPELIVAGGFSAADGDSILGIARWNGTRWSGLGRGVSASAGQLTRFDDGQGTQLYVAGDFSRAGTLSVPGFARWNGSEWSAVPGVTNTGVPNIYGMERFEDAAGPALYVWGNFANFLGTQIPHLARWNGTTWSGLGTLPSWPVIEFLIHDDGSGARPYIWSGQQVHRWNGTTWTSLGAPSSVQSAGLVSFDDGLGPTLWATGLFRHPLTAAPENLARWNGSTWAFASISGPDVYLHGLRVLGQLGGPSLFAATVVAGAGNDAVELLRLESAGWTGVGGRMGPGIASVMQVADVGGGRCTFVAGSFTHAGEVHALGVAELENGAWHALGAGLGVSGGGIRCFCEHDDGSGRALYCGGSIEAAGATTIDHVARWDGTGWSRVGAGPGAPVHALAGWDDGSGSALFAGTDRGVARWNGTSWDSITGSAIAVVRALATYDSGQGAELVAAGTFQALGGVPIRGIGAWNGTSWRQLGPGQERSLHALAVHDDGAGPALFIGGDGELTPAPALGLVRWNGSSFSPVGTPQLNYVRSLVVHDDGNGPALYAGGAVSFGTGQVRRWRQGTWSALGGEFLGGTPSSVFALASVPIAGGSALYCGGNFATESGTAVHGIVKWVGDRWMQVGAGVVPLYLGAGVQALTAFDSGTGPLLCLGGNFGMAGGRPAQDFALVRDSTPPLPPVEGGPIAEVPVAESYCAGDGLPLACPCGNTGEPGHGCRNLVVPSGARLDAIGVGSVANDTIVLTVRGIPNGQVVHFLQGTERANEGAGSWSFDGIVCLDGVVLRIGTKFSASGVAGYPESFDLPVSSAGLLGPLGGTRHYQAQYRDVVAQYCTPSAANWTNGLSIVWRP